VLCIGKNLREKHDDGHEAIACYEPWFGHLHCLTLWFGLNNNNNIFCTDLTSSGGNPFHQEGMRTSRDLTPIRCTRFLGICKWLYYNYNMMDRFHSQPSHHPREWFHRWGPWPSDDSSHIRFNGCWSNAMWNIIVLDHPLGSGSPSFAYPTLMSLSIFPTTNHQASHPSYEQEAANK
jgi:hypothetical protein